MKGRLVNETDLEWIRQRREAFPHGSRQQLSVHLAQEWQWRNQAGRLIENDVLQLCETDRETSRLARTLAPPTLSGYTAHTPDRIGFAT